MLSEKKTSKYKNLACLVVELVAYFFTFDLVYMQFVKNQRKFLLIFSYYFFNISNVFVFLVGICKYIFPCQAFSVKTILNRFLLFMPLDYIFF